MKRLLDMTISACLLLLFAPIILLISFALFAKEGSPIFFKQVRAGVYGIPFEIFKFRSMRNVYDENGQPLSDECRLTSFGNFLRATSLDELPQLWNVLKGDMSLVGPRPLFTTYLSLYTPAQARRHEVRPGITGWVQIKGRNTISWEEKFEMDVWYVDNRTLSLDIKILLNTIRVVVMRQGISKEGHVTMPKFTGTKPK